MKVTAREENFQNAIDELTKALLHVGDIRKLYLKPMRLSEELNATGRVEEYLGKTIARLTKRIEISQKLNRKREQ